MEEDPTIRDPHKQQNEESQKTGDGVSRRRFMELMPMAGLAAMGTTRIDSSNGPKIRPVDTMAALLEAPTSQPIWVRAFYADTEGGGGHFWWDPNEDKQNHNGGTIIDPDHMATPGDVGWYSAENIGTGCWKRFISNSINVRWFGATGDNVTDDTNSIQATIDYIASNNDTFGRAGGTVYLPSRPDQTTYRFRQLDLNASGICLKGDGKAKTSLKLIDNLNTDYPNITNAILQKESRQRIENLQIEGNRDNVNGVNCFDAETSGFNGLSVYRNVHVVKFDGIAYKFKKSNATSLYSCQSVRCKTGVTIERSSPINFYNLSIDKWTEHAFVVNGTPTSNQVNVYGIYIEASIDVPISGNSAIQINSLRSEDYVKIRGLYMNGNWNKQDLDTSGIEFNNSIYFDNCEIEGVGVDVKTPYLFNNIDSDKIGNNNLDKIRFDSSSGSVEKYVGFKNEDSIEFLAESNDVNLSGSSVTDIMGFESIGELKIKKITLQVLTTTGSGPDTIDVGIDGIPDFFGTVSVPSNASPHTYVDATDELTKRNAHNRTENRLVCRASGGGSGSIRIRLNCMKYD